ncbi:MAG: polyphenol oxidase family protein [Spirochaetaceae bacterium]|nr:polyphenol oxidase family protein [Spirochaetaceae bacterium]
MSEHKRVDFAFFPFIFEGKAVQGVSCALSFRAAGNMGLDGADANGWTPARSTFYKALGLNAGNVYSARQTHTKNIVVVDKGTPNFHTEVDGFVTARQDAALAVTVADCLPVLLLDVRGIAAGHGAAGNGAFAAVHSGWKGTGIAAEALRLMGKHYGTKPEDAAAILGPCICGDCYEVDGERAAIFEKEFGQGSLDAYPLGQVTRKEYGRYFIDLRAANAALLADAGVRNIAYCTDCTFTNPLLGSYRREGAEHYTKMLCLITKTNNAPS